MKTLITQMRRGVRETAKATNPPLTIRKRKNLTISTANITGSKYCWRVLIHTAMTRRMMLIAT
jgi:hypothetical protein